MKVNFDPAVEARIEQRAIQAGISVEAVVLQAVAALLAQDPGTAMDVRGKVLPAKHLAGGIITPQ